MHQINLIEFDEKLEYIAQQRSALYSPIIRHDRYRDATRGQWDHRLCLRAGVQAGAYNIMHDLHITTTLAGCTFLEQRDPITDLIYVGKLQSLDPSVFPSLTPELTTGVLCRRVVERHLTAHNGYLCLCSLHGSSSLQVYTECVRNMNVGMSRGICTKCVRIREFVLQMVDAMAENPRGHPYRLRGENT